MNKRFSTTKQANTLIQGRQSINLLSKRLLTFCGSKIDPTAANPNEVRLSFKEYAAFSQTRATHNWKGMKQILKKISRNLSANPLILETTDKTTNKRRYEEHRWVQVLLLEETTQTIVIIYTDAVRKLFVFLQSQPYTNTINIIGQYRSIFTIRIKEIIELEQFKNRSHFDITVAKLKWQLGVEQYYPRFYDFRCNVLEVAQKELKRHRSPVQFSFDTLGIHGGVVKRGVHALRIYPLFSDRPAGEEQPDSAKKPTMSVPPSDQPLIAPTTTGSTTTRSTTKYATQYSATFKKIKGWGVSVANINRHIEQKGIAQVQAAIAFVESKQQVNSRSGLYIRAFEEGWKTEVAVKKGQAQTARKQQVARQQQAQNLQQLTKAISLEGTNRIKRISDTLVKENDWLLTTSYNQMVDKKKQKGGGITLKSLPPDAADAYASGLHKWGIIKEIEEMFPERFKLALVDWPQERPLEYKDMSLKANQYYKNKLYKIEHSAADKERLIADAMARKFRSLYLS